MYSFISTTSCGRTFHSLTALSEVPLSFILSCQVFAGEKTKPQIRRSFLYITSIYFFLCHYNLWFLLQAFLNLSSSLKCPDVWSHSVWMLLHTSNSLPCIPLLHSFQVRLHVIFRCFWEDGERILGEACLKVEKIFLGKKHIKNKWRFTVMLHICKQQNCSSIIKRRFKTGKKPLRFVVEIKSFFCAFVLYRAEIICPLCFPLKWALHYIL